MGRLLLPGSFLGRVEKQLERSGLVLSESKYHRGETLGMHRHARPFFYLVLEGDCRDTFDGRTIIADQRTIVFHSAEEEHANQWKHGGKCFHLEFAPQVLRRFDGSAVFQRSFEMKRSLASFLALSLHCEFHRADVFSPLTIEGVAIEWLAKVARYASIEERSVPRWLAQVCEMLHDQCESDLSLSTIADEVDVHPAHLSRTFRQHFGQTPGSYLRRIRIEVAANLLRNTPLSIAEVALRTGFSDQSHLTRSFARELNVSPGSYRRATARKKIDETR
jgi:AraC family transcriptional regulator